MAVEATRQSEIDTLGLSGEDLLSMHRFMVLARLIDEAAIRQNRQGKAPFVIPVSDHEACQVGTAWAMRRGRDIWLPYYRDLASCSSPASRRTTSSWGSSRRPTTPPPQGGRCRPTEIGRAHV